MLLEDTYFLKQEIRLGLSATSTSVLLSMFDPARQKPVRWAPTWGLQAEGEALSPEPASLRGGSCGWKV